MSSTVFKPAVRANVPLLLGFMGGTGSGKTYSAFEVAAGIADVVSPGRPFGVVDTESGRALHYADRFKFEHAELRPPFRPEAYVDAILAGEQAGFPVVVVDSTSHVWAGEGGVLDWQEEELDRMAGTDWRKREACKMAAWIKPKVAHKKMVQRLLQLRCHVILCFRAEEKVEMVKEDGKVKIKPKESLTGLDGWIPICEKNLPFELTASFLLTAAAPGTVKPIKLQAQHRPFVPLDHPITRDTGRALAEWARGGASSPAPADVDVQTLTDLGESKAREGTTALQTWWTSLPTAAKHALKLKLPDWKQTAEGAEARKGAAA